FMASEQAFWRNFCTALDRLDLFERWPGSTIADHAKGNRELQTSLRDIFATRTSAQWIAFSDESNTPIAPVNTPKTLPQDPQFQARFTMLGHEQHGADMLGFPAHFAGEELPVPTPAPTVGEHTNAVLASLGYDEDRVHKLWGTGAFG
ncbi:MAG: crotonobetainyl-CoA:carnitine CoA-transferase CaiB-like acyl-CoA transferase, partial [Glaciecola sp.]